MTKRNLFLHIGTPKTGTTAIQNFCFLNISELQKNGFHYFQSPIYHDNSHHSLSFLLWGNESFDIPELRGITLDKLFTEIENEMQKLPASINNFILSSEVLLDLAADKKIEPLQNFIKKHFDSVTVICYIRRQDHYLHSVYLEWMKTNFEEVRTKSIMEFEKKFNANYYDILKHWSDLFGIENMAVRPYEKKQFKNGSLFSDFLNILQLNLNSHYKLPPKEHSNLSINSNAYQILISMPFIDFNALEKTGLNLYQTDSKNINLLRAEDRIAIIKKYQNVNEKIAREYLHRKDGKLFSESITNKETYILNNNENVIPALIEQLIVLSEELITIKSTESRLGEQYLSSIKKENDISKKNTKEFDQLINELKNKIDFSERKYSELMEQNKFLLALFKNQQRFLSQIQTEENPIK